MKRLKLRIFLWTVLLITVFFKCVAPSSVAKAESTKSTKTTSRLQASTVTVRGTSSRSTSSKPSSPRSTQRPKGLSSKRTSTTPPSSVGTAIDVILKLQSGGSSLQKKKQSTKTTTTTLSPLEIMNKLYQMHGVASHGVSASHSAYQSHSSTKKKEQGQASSSMDDIYRLHALAIAQVPHGNKKGSESSCSAEKITQSPNMKQNYQHGSSEQIYQQHSSLPSSMHHIMAQHSIQSQHSNSRPQKTSSQSTSSHDPSPSSLSTIMQPLLKQLTPVGAGISVVLAPLLLFNGFLQFFSNMSRFLNNFAQTILPVRRPMGQAEQNQNSYFQNLGPVNLKRQPRDSMVNPENLGKIEDLTVLFMKALKEAGKQ